MTKDNEYESESALRQGKEQLAAFEREKRAILKRPYGDHRNQAPDISHSGGLNRQAAGIRLLGTTADLGGD